MNQPDIIPVREGGYVLDEAWSVRTDLGEFFIPSGFKYDGASVPRVIWSVVGLRPDGLLRAGALLHDYLYRHGGEVPKDTVVPVRSFTRKEADELFHSLMARAGVNPRRAYLAYVGVRWFGGSSWQESEANY